MAVVMGSYGVEFVENPFTTNGELSKKADYIIRHSKITRTEIQITDPDCIQLLSPLIDTKPSEPNEENDKAEANKPLEAVNQINGCEEPEKQSEDVAPEEVVHAEISNKNECHPAGAHDPDVSPADAISQVPPQTDSTERKVVEAEVLKVKASVAEPQQAEEVRLKKKGCCSLL